jgi:hypothetical protein
MLTRERGAMAETGRWILDWQDRSRDPNRRFLISADSVDEVRDAVARLLANETWTPPDADEFKGPDALPASQAFRDEVLDLSNDANILGLWSVVRFECDDGVLELVRER